MGRIEESIEIKCPVDKVFAYTTVAENWPKWHDEILEAEQTSQGEVGIGTTSRVKTHSMGQTSEMTAKVTEYVLDKKWGKELTSKSAVINDQLIFDSIEGGTKFTMVYDVKISGFAKMLSSKINSEMRKESKQDLINLRGILEAET
jgi:Polyketide cyclase / dehydrase and lipid transport